MSLASGVARFWRQKEAKSGGNRAAMFEGFFDLSKPVGLDETWASIFVVVFLMWLGYRVLKQKADSQKRDE